MSVPSADDAPQTAAHWAIADLADEERDAFMNALTAENDAGVVHIAPPIGSGMMPCCGKTPLEVSPLDRMTVYRDQATCHTEAGAIPPSEPT